MPWLTEEMKCVAHPTSWKVEQTARGAVVLEMTFAVLSRIAVDETRINVSESMYEVRGSFCLIKGGFREDMSPAEAEPLVMRQNINSLKRALRWSGDISELAANFSPPDVIIEVKCSRYKDKDYYKADRIYPYKEVSPGMTAKLSAIFKDSPSEPPPLPAPVEQPALWDFPDNNESVFS